MLYGQNSLAVNSYLDIGLVTQRQPEFIHFLVFADKIRLVDPEGWLFGRMAFNFCNSKSLPSIQILP